MNYHVARNSREIATVSESQLKAGLESGLYLPTDHIWNESMGGWKQASDVLGLVGICFPTPPSAPVLASEASAGVWAKIMIAAFVALAALGLIGFLDENRDKTLNELPSDAANTFESTMNEPGGDVQQLIAGKVVRSHNLEVVIISAEKRSSVGDGVFQEDAATGGVYIAVRWSYKNISTKPLGILEHPILLLKAPDGTLYSQDMGAAFAYNAQIQTDEKILSDLNPGITVRSSAVFEVSREGLGEPSRWALVIDGESTTEVNLGG